MFSGANYTWIQYTFNETGTWNMVLEVRDGDEITYSNRRPATAGYRAQVELPIIPEFSSFLIVPLFMCTSLVGIIVCRRRRANQHSS